MATDHPLPRPVEISRSPGDFDPTSNTKKVMPVKVSKGLDLHAVALPGEGHIPAWSEDAQEAARVFYVAATRVTHRLVLTMSSVSAFSLGLRSSTSESTIL